MDEAIKFLYQLWVQENLDVGTSSKPKRSKEMGEFLDIVAPKIITRGETSQYSAQQIKAQKILDEKNLKEFTIGAPPAVKIAVVAVEGLAYSTGQPGGDMYTPAVRTYEDSITWGGSGSRVY